MSSKIDRERSNPSADEVNPLSVRLRTASKPVHSVSDSLVNARLIALLTDAKLYARAIGCFYFIFERIELRLDEAKERDPRLCQFHAAAVSLYRSAAFATDLQYFLGTAWREDVEIYSLNPAVRSYLKHIDVVAAEQPAALVAHAFTQLMAVASGGQILARMIRKGLGLPELDGTAAYRYSNGHPRVLKEAMKEQIDMLDSQLTAAEVDSLIEEHCRVFSYNNAIIKAYRVGALSPIVAAFKLCASSISLKAVGTTAVAVGVLGGALYLAKTWQR